MAMNRTSGGSGEGVAGGLIHAYSAGALANAGAGGHAHGLRTHHLPDRRHDCQEQGLVVLYANGMMNHSRPWTPSSWPGSPSTESTL